ncbi:outer membrane beta-barrel protein [Ferruginibacter sp. SUN106]|uniref:outer membrane beta-barrel protein n=1 Tax=Ferruginibacter sp. SUN106 TaxID=2978348 RepID=UPI003D360F68
MKKALPLIVSVLLSISGFAQKSTSIPATSFNITVVDKNTQAIEGVTITLISGDKIISTMTSDASGNTTFINISKGAYTFKLSHTGYQTITTQVYNVPTATNKIVVVLPKETTTLQTVNITSKKPLIQQKEGKTIINVEAAVTNTGTTILEVLEKSPGVMVDKNGGLSLQGKAGVLVMIDDKPTYLSGADLNNLLSSMSSTQVDQIELMPNPPAKYDASGNAGIINIKTKKNKVKGFNGTVTLAGSQGVYPKNNNSLLLNYRTGKFNTFFNYSANITKYFTEIYALRKYYDQGNVTAILDQPTYFSGTVVNHTIKTGIDYYVTPNTTIGLVLGGTRVKRNGTGDATATWLNAAGAVDSSVATNVVNVSHYKSNSLNTNLRLAINKQQDLAIDLDWLSYHITNQQQFNNHLLTAGGYNQAARGNIPTTITILSAKADYTLRFAKNSTLLSGFKTSHIRTDNTAAYQNFDGSNWQEDYGKSNHFIYEENINALYTSIETKYKRFSMQAGLRYEATGYDARQLGNIQVKDSAFSRNYDGLFPGGYISYQADSSNSFTFTAGRRIDRPAFQTLNPFTSIINKYTFQNGNPFIVPQYSTNLELSHQYKQLLTTTIAYSIIKNYFSQIFLNDTITGLLYYSQGNVGRTHNLGLSTMLSVAPTKWWSFTLQALYNHKELKGFNGDANFKSDINQLNLNMSNQFSFAKIYNGELSGFYTTRARNDLQEELYPTGQLSLGVSRPVLKKKGTLKLSLRDIFFTNVMEGLTQFPKATEYFILHRDSRVINLSFTYRFGKAYKATKRSGGGAGDEMERVGNG